MIGEMFPATVRGLAAGTTTCCAYLFSFVLVKTYPQLKRAVGTQGVFCFYEGMALLGTLFVWFCLPETQGKILEEVEQLYARKRTTTPTVVRTATEP
jgi:sugar phosphate permease